MIAVPLFLVALALEPKPLVLQGERLAVDDMDRIKELLKKNNPRKLRVGEIKSISLTERDLNLFLIHALTYAPYSERLSCSILLKPKSACGRLTIRLPDNPLGSYLNITGVLTANSKTIDIHDVHIGVLRVPRWLVRMIGRSCHKILLRRQDYRELVEGFEYIKSVDVNDDSLVVVYQWEPEVVDRLQSHGRELLLPDHERERLLAYYKELGTIATPFISRDVSLIKILQPLAKFAAECSESGDPIAENRALIQVMAVYVLNKNLLNITGPSANGTVYPPRALRLKLRGRDDLVKHFMVSAAIAASANSNTASVIGLFKEVDDSRGGSGFSFADLAADRAGVKWAELATSSSNSAKLLQQQMKENLTEDDIMPPIDNLPEGIMEHEFKKTYGELDSKTYQLVEKEIEERLSACRLYQ